MLSTHFFFSLFFFSLFYSLLLDIFLWEKYKINTILCEGHGIHNG